MARWFFRVGGAAGTIAKTISAYDMTVSDAIYGQSERYVSRQRLATMLDHEFGLLQERLQIVRRIAANFQQCPDDLVPIPAFIKDADQGGRSSGRTGAEFAQP